MTIQPTSTYTATSFLINSTKQRQSPTSDPAIAAASTAKSADTATISQAARDMAAQENKITTAADDPKAAAKYMQQMAQGLAGSNQYRAAIQSDPFNPLWARNAAAYFDPSVGLGPGIDLSWGKSGDDINKMGPVHYIGGELVTPESQAYQTKLEAGYRSEAKQLYDTGVANKTPPGDILLSILKLQDQQPARFRTMMGWPIAADFVNGSNTNTQAQTTKV